MHNKGKGKSCLPPWLSLQVGVKESGGLGLGARERFGSLEAGSTEVQLLSLQLKGPRSALGVQPFLP